MDALTPGQWDELIAAEQVDPIGERRADMRTAFLVSHLYMSQGADKHVSLWDVLADFDYQMDGHRGDEPQSVSPDQMARIGRGGR